MKKKRFTVRSEADYLQQWTALKQAFRRMQARCKHPRLEYVSEPAGGNYSYNRCCTCGKGLS